MKGSKGATISQPTVDTQSKKKKAEPPKKDKADTIAECTYSDIEDGFDSDVKAPPVITPHANKRLTIIAHQNSRGTEFRDQVLYRYLDCEIIRQTFHNALKRKTQVPVELMDAYVADTNYQASGGTKTGDLFGIYVLRPSFLCTLLEEEMKGEPVEELVKDEVKFINDFFFEERYKLTDKLKLYMPVYIDHGWFIYVFHMEHKKVFIVDFDENIKEGDEEEENARHLKRVKILMKYTAQILRMTEGPIQDPDVQSFQICKCSDIPKSKAIGDTGMLCILFLINILEAAMTTLQLYGKGTNDLLFRKYVVWKLLTSKSNQEKRDINSKLGV